MAELSRFDLTKMKAAKVKVPQAPCTFKVIRRADETGVSGNGCVCEGVVFTTGKVCVQWLSEAACVQSWDRLEDFFNVHINSHPANRSLIIWSDGAVWEHTE